MRQKIVSVVPEHGSLFEIASPAGVWSQERATQIGIGVTYVQCGISSSSVELESGLSLTGLQVLADHVDDAHTIIIPTWPVGESAIPEELTEQLKAAHVNGTRLVGLCLGAFVVAATGLLDGRSGVTHWRYREMFEAMNPSVTFEPDTLYVDHGSVVTSAGSAAAVDCCIHLLRVDHGAEVASAVARSLVTAPHRSGTQSQFAGSPPLRTGPDQLSSALAEAVQNLSTIADVSDLARIAGVSRRTLERQFRNRLGVSPRDWLDEQRVTRACRLLEQPDLSVEEVATMAGFGSAPTMRRSLRKRRSTTPTAYRNEFGKPSS